MDFIDSLTDLRAIYGTVSEIARKKQMTQLDAHARNFLSKSPFVVIGSQDGAGLGDATPKGDAPGFTLVLDDRTIAIPDRPGNNRVDTWENVVRNPAVGLLFLIPGMQETLRINGRGRLTVDAELCARLAMNGRPAKAALVVETDEVYMHCAKAFMRSNLWKPETWPDRDEMPTFGEIIRDQVQLADSAEAIDQRLAEGYQKTMW